MSDNTPIEALRRQEWFDSLDDEELQPLLEVADPRKLMTGDALWSRGDRPEAAYVLVEGRIETRRTVQPDGRQTEQITRAGSLLGLSALVSDWTHDTSAYPMERTDVLRLERTAFEEMFEARRPVAFRLVDAMTERLVEEIQDANRRMQEVFGQPGETLRTLRRRARNSKRR